MQQPKLQLCSDLKVIYDYELAHGNTLAAIAAPAGTECPYAVILAKPLKICETPEADNLPEFIQYWESRDPHYEIEAGFVCSKHRHSIAGPLAD